MTIRFRMNKLMLWVAVVAVNLTVLRALFARRSLLDLYVGGILWGLLQFALYRSIRRSGRPRAFWLGLAAGGSLATLSLDWAAARSTGSPPAARPWQGYYRAAFDLLEPTQGWLARFLGGSGAEVAFVLLLSLSLVVPIILVAGGAGLLARRMIPIAGPPPDRSGPSLAP